MMFSMFFYVFAFFCSFFIIIRNTRDRRDFWLLVTQMSKLSQKYDYSLLVVPALVKFFKYEISIHRMDNHLKSTTLDWVR